MYESYTIFFQNLHHVLYNLFPEIQNIIITKNNESTYFNNKKEDTLSENQFGFTADKNTITEWNHPREESKYWTPEWLLTEDCSVLPQIKYDYCTKDPILPDSNQTT